MAAEYLTTINQIDRLAILSAEGAVTVAGLYEAQDKLRLQPEWRADLDLLVVFQAGTSLERIDFGEISRYADMFRQWNRRFRTGPHPMTAVVTDVGIFNAACMIWAALRRDNWLVDVAFHSSKESAMHWINSSRKLDVRKKAVLSGGAPVA
ncbi:hypothetical protein [Maricaulis sp. MIT060901]|uniref:hypothetical protein n=1 Tax=Maricaulis sp. MIT060901 TaxID=3096993 RepID=UPI00399B2F0E